MREAMASAVVGDDVYGEDPTVIQLEELAAKKVGTEAALFVSSGTMGNLIGILSHADRGDQCIVGLDAHCFGKEAGGMSALGGVIPKPLPTDIDGKMSPMEVNDAVSPNDPHFARTRLILLENTYGARNGAPQPPEYFAAMREIADRHGLSIHLDGARLFNAATALEIHASEIVKYVDSVSFCLSKGLCAPIGSVLCGSSEFINRAHRARKLLGGGMRQAGIIAAAGIIGLQVMTERLGEDHKNARELAVGLNGIPGIKIKPEHIRTNIVFFDLADEVSLEADQISRRLRTEANILLETTGARSFRAVTHYWISNNDVQALLATMSQIIMS